MVHEELKKAIDNEIVLGRMENVNSKAKIKKIWFYYVFMIVFARKKRIRINDAVIINGKRALELSNNDKYNENRVSIYYGKVSSSFFYIINNISFFSCFSRLERIIVLKDAIIQSFKYSFLNINLIYWIEYFFLKEWICCNKPKSIKVYGHFDRLTTILSYLCKNNSIDFIIQQHGVLGSKRFIPSLVYATDVYAFNEVEKENFRNTVIENKECNYYERYIGVTSFIKFETNRFSVGLADQPNEYIQKFIIDLVTSTTDADFYIMLHPRTEISVYEKIKKPNVKVLKYEKVINVDVLIAFYSSLFVDYIKNNFQGKIILTNYNGLFNNYTKFYDNIILMSKNDDIINYINSRVSNKKV